MKRKRLIIFPIITFIFSLVVIGLLGYAMMQPIVKSGGEEKYLDYIKFFFESFPEIIKSSAKDKIFPMVLVAFLIAVMVMGVFLTALSVIVVLISGIGALIGKSRVKTVLPLAASCFNLAFLSLLMSSYYTGSVELGLGGYLIIAATGLAIFAQFLEEYTASPKNKHQVRYLIASILRIILSGLFVYISLVCFGKLYKHIPSETEFGQALFSSTQYNVRIEEDLPKKLFAFVSVFTFALGLVLNILIPMLPAICGSRSRNQRLFLSNHSKRYIIHSIVMAILLAGAYYGTVLIDETPADYAMGSGFLTAIVLFGVVLVMGIVTAILDPKGGLVDGNGSTTSKPQFAPQSQLDPRASSDTPKTEDN